MTAVAVRYVKVLWKLDMPVDEISEAKKIYEENPDLAQALTNPSIFKEEKHAVIERIFPRNLQNFMKILCDYSDMDYFPEIAEEYQRYVNEHKRVLNAQLRYVTAPDEKQLDGLKKFLLDEFDVKDAEIEMVPDETLVGGFVLSAEGREWDWSLKGRIRSMQEKLQG